MKTKEEAISSGIHLISVLGDRDRPADIWAPDEAGKSRLVWKSSKRA